MSKRVTDEVRIMESLRALPQEKREVVLNLAVAEFGAKAKAKPAAKKRATAQPAFTEPKAAAKA